MVYSKIVHKIRALEICFGSKSNKKSVNEAIRNYTNLDLEHSYFVITGHTDTLL